MVQAFPETAVKPTGDGAELGHLYCCDENTALCGVDIADAPPIEPGEPICVVCDDNEMVCPICHQNAYGEIKP